MKIEFDSRKIAFLLIFSIAGLILYQFNLSKIVGGNDQYFTGFQLIGPIGGGIISPALGAVSALGVEIADFVLLGTPLNMMSFLLLFPMAFAAWYFGSKKINSALIGIVCMVLFWLSPVGAQAWYYALYWLIPLGAHFFKDNLFARSLGATFTAHAIGSIVFLYSVSMPATAWIALIPVVAVERLTFAAGIAISYVVMNTILSAYSSITKADISFLNLERRYSLLKA